MDGLLPQAASRPTSVRDGNFILSRCSKPSVHRFALDRPAHVVLRMVACANRAGAAGAESAVVSVTVDGSFAGDVIVASPRPAELSAALGRLRRGDHTVMLRFSDERSPPAMDRARVEDVVVIAAEDNDPLATALRHAPVLHGRAIPHLGGPCQSAVTDMPLLAWHEVRPRGDGDRILEYSVLWSNEDAGTDTPTLFARWGRTTDIEWIYRVAVDREGRSIPGTAVYQGPGHQTLAFGGRYEGDRPLLQVATANNMVTDRVTGSMRFALGSDAEIPGGRARETMMLLEPWTFAVMAAELRREGKILNRDPDSPDAGDPRDYLFVEVSPAAGPLNPYAVGARVHGDARRFRSDHGLPGRGIHRDAPALVAVKLPQGTEPKDIASVGAIPIGPARGAPNVEAVAAFVLDEQHRPVALDPSVLRPRDDTFDRPDETAGEPAGG